MAQKPVFTIVMSDGREMKGELYPETAPQSVGNFASLANSGFYDGRIFHAVSRQGCHHIAMVIEFHFTKPDFFQLLS